jgi:hypothetical protein
MKKKFTIASIAVALLIVLLVLLTCYISFLHLLGGCFWLECAPERNFSVRDWELPAYLFPSNATVGHIYRPFDRMGDLENGVQFMFWEDEYGTAAYNIARYSRSNGTVWEFEFEVDHMVDSDTKERWVRPNDITFFSSTADEMYIACGNRVQKRCQMVARYQEYYIYFAATINNKMTHASFEKIVKYIDEQISSRLYP